MKTNKNKCKCGQALEFTPTPFMQREKRVCPKCGRIHYVDDSPIRWDKVNEEKK